MPERKFTVLVSCGKEYECDLALNCKDIAKHATISLPDEESLAVGVNRLNSEQPLGKCKLDIALCRTTTEIPQAPKARHRKFGKASQR